uniref:Ribonuclease H-like domain-containing protein n=1 Tax=Tanacetum cinerariifolium TaxID=118510 RepID=A0A699J3K4_TANCI|nr:ribonuclease H-like domain-containing protein [Tanacetum cinerariifolium]
MSNATTMAPGMYKLDLIILAHQVKNNSTTHEYYLKHIIEQAAILKEVVEQAKSQNPLDSASYSSYMYVKKIQELLGYVRDTCPDIHKPSEKLVAVKPVNKKKTVRFADTAASSSNIPKAANKPSLSSIGVKPSTSASGSKPSSNTKNDRILRSPSSNEKNKVEVVQIVLCTVKFNNDQVAKIMGDTTTSSRICLLSKATKTKPWLWHRSLSHLNFGSLNHLARNGLVRGIPRLKFKKDHLCFACAMGKSKKQSHKPKAEDTNQDKLYLLHMDLCGHMRVASVNGKKYILIIMDDYSWFTWVKFLASKDEAPDFIIKFLKMIQVRLNAFVRNIRTYNETKFVNQTLRDYYEQPVFDEFSSPPASVASLVPVKEAHAPVESTGSPSSTTFDQDEPSLKTISEESLSLDVISTTVHSDAPISEHPIKWTKDHPLQNIIGDPSRPVSTRL